jgi:hypothetical protein
MKLTKSYLRKLIKEELENSMKDLDGPGEDFYEFVRILVAGGTKNSAIHDAVQATEYAESASSEDVEDAIAKAKANPEGKQDEDL